MRTILAVATVALTLGVLPSNRVQAGPLPKGAVPADAGWVAHVDLDQLQKSQLGTQLIKTFVEPKAQEVSRALSASFGIDLDWRQIHSVTAYGTQLAKNPEKDAVVLIQSDLPVQATLDKLTSALKTANDKNPALPINRSQVDGFDLFGIHQDAFLSLANSNLLVLGKTKDSVTRARKQLSAGTTAGKAPALLDEPPTGEMPLAWVAASGSLADGFDLPPQAAVLKKTDGVRLSLTEVTQDLLAKLTFKARTAEIVDQLQQALQGVVALATLGTSENPQAQQLLKGVRVDRRDQDVELGIRMPLTELTKWLEPKAKKQRAARR